MTALQQDLLEKTFKRISNKPVGDVLQEYNEWIDYSWHLFKDKASHPKELKLFQFPWELVYEVVRKEFFSKRPKRAESYFVFNKLEDARSWETRCSDYVVCEVHEIDMKCYFSGDMYYLDCVEINSTFEEISESVKKYWSGQMSKTPIVETLLQGFFKLKRI